jgi:hypothetical protein
MGLDFENFDRIVQKAAKDRANMSEYREITNQLESAGLSDIERRCLQVRLAALESESVTETITDSDYTKGSIYN